MQVQPPQETYDLVCMDDHVIHGVLPEEIDVVLALHAVIAAAGPRASLEIHFREVVAQCFQEWGPYDITVFIADALRRVPPCSESPSKPLDSAI